MRILIALPFAIALAACSNADGGSGGAAKVQAHQTVSNSSTGSVTQTVGSTTTGAGGSGGTATTDVKVDFRLALDPAAFAQLFGNIPPIVQPTNEQLGKVIAHAANSGDSELRDRAYSCLEGEKTCSIVKQ